MACFLVPMGLAIITTVLSRKFPERYRISWLNALLWGGVLMLAVEHLAHGEVVPYPPFLTAGLNEVIPEMLTVGLPITVGTVGLWSAMVFFNLRLNISEKIRVGPKLGHR